MMMMTMVTTMMMTMVMTMLTTRVMTKVMTFGTAMVTVTVTARVTVMVTTMMMKIVTLQSTTMLMVMVMTVVMTLAMMMVTSDNCVPASRAHKTLAMRKIMQMPSFAQNIVKCPGSKSYSFSQVLFLAPTSAPALQKHLVSASCTSFKL